VDHLQILKFYALRTSQKKCLRLAKIASLAMASLQAPQITDKEYL
jgi:hypothetical protein